MKRETHMGHQLAPIIALPRSLTAEKLLDLQCRYGNRYRIVTVGSSLTGWHSPRILVLTEALTDSHESAWAYDWIDGHLACRLLPEGKMAEIVWDSKKPGTVTYSPMRRKGGRV